MSQRTAQTEARKQREMMMICAVRETFRNHDILIWKLTDFLLFILENLNILICGVGSWLFREIWHYSPVVWVFDLCPDESHMEEWCQEGCVYQKRIPDTLLISPREPGSSSSHGAYLANVPGLYVDKAGSYDICFKPIFSKCFRDLAVDFLPSSPYLLLPCSWAWNRRFA